MNQNTPLSVPRLPSDRIEAMIDHALTYPQMRPRFMPFANTNIRVRMGVAASVLIFMAASVLTIFPPSSSTSELNDVASEMSDYMMYDLIDDAS